MSQNEVVEKYRNMVQGEDSEYAELILDRVMNLEKVGDISQILNSSTQ